jgi:hypothetical protein
MYRNFQREGEENLSTLASGFVFLLANPEFFLLAFGELASGYPHPCLYCTILLYYRQNCMLTTKNASCRQLQNKIMEY